MQLGVQRSQPVRLSERKGEFLGALFPDGTFKSLTSSFFTLIREGHTDWINRSLMELVHPAEEHLLRSAFGDSFHGNTAVLHNLCCRTANSRLVILNLTLVPCTFENEVREILVFGQRATESVDVQDLASEEEPPSRSGHFTWRGRDFQQSLLGFFEQMLANAPIGFCFFSRAHLYTCVNDRLAELNGYAPDQHLGHSPAELLPNVAEKIDEALKKVLVTEQPVMDVEIGFSTGSREVHTLQSFYPIGASDGVIGIGCLVVDITERKKMEQRLRASETRFRLAIEGAELATWDYDPGTGILIWSDMAKAMAGLPAQAEVNHNVFLSGLHPEDRPKVEKAIANALDPKSGGSYRIEYRTVGLRDKRERWISSRGQAIFDETTHRPLRFIGVSLDMTERRRREEALAKTTAELKRSNEDLHRFAYTASHDLKEPLRMITCYIQLLERQQATQLDDESKHYLGFVLDGCKQMKSLIDDLLSYAAVSNSTRAFEEQSVEVLLSKALSNLRVSVNESGTQVFRTPLPHIHCDPGQMVQLFQNLLGNAIKYRGQVTPKIQVSADLNEAKKEWIFSVKDNGIGLDMKDADSIFDLFRRLHCKHEYSGTGIGLATCKRIAERHGGKIWVSSRPGEGSTFHFTVPAEKSDQA